MDIATLAPAVIANIILCVLVVMKHAATRRMNTHAEYSHIAQQAVRSIRSLYTRPIVTERLKAIICDDSRPRANRREILALQNAVGLTQEEKAAAKLQAVKEFNERIVHYGGCFPCTHPVSQSDIDRYIEDAYRTLPSLSSDMTSLAHGMLQLLQSSVTYNLECPSTPVNLQVAYDDATSNV